MFAAVGVAAVAGVKIVYEAIRKPSIQEIVAETLKNPETRAKLAANIESHNALLKRFEARRRTLTKRDIFAQDEVV